MDSLHIGSGDEKAALAKVGPPLMPNVALVQQLQAQHPGERRWRAFRNAELYLYVMNWMHQCRGYVKLQSELFDSHLFEMELFSLVQPPPADDLALLVNRVKLALISKVHGRKVASLAMFEPLFRLYFGPATPLGDGDDDDGGELRVAEHAPVLFDELFVDQKITVLYLLMEEVTHYADFKEYLVKNNLPADLLRSVSIYDVPSKKNSPLGESYHLLFDNTALYRKTVAAPEMQVPKKRKVAPEDPEEYFSATQFDVRAVSYELLFHDIYGLDSYIQLLLKNRKLKENKALLDVIRLPSFVSHVFALELRKRKYLMSRKRDLEMSRLLATRKRSSRIEAKEKQKSAEEQKRKEQERDDLRLARSRRSERTRLSRFLLSMDYTAGLSREERLNQRRAELETEEEDKMKEELRERDEGEKTEEPREISEQKEIKEEAPVVEVGDVEVVEVQED